MAAQVKSKSFKMKKQLEKVSHDYIRYANCWEDTDILLQALEIDKTDRILSIASAGDNSLSMLIHNPELVVAIDINPIQLNLVRLKIAAIKALNQDEFLRFIGFIDSNQRLTLFQKVKSQLSPELQTYWNGRLKEIQLGIIDQGKFEKYFHAFRTKVLPLIHSKKRISELFRPKSAKEQSLFFDKHWNTWRWRVLFKFFFSKYVMGKLGRDPEFLKEVKISVSDFILHKAFRNLRSTECQHNYYLQYILTGCFTTNLPHYARKENYEKIKSNIDHITTFEGLAENAFSKYEGFNKFNLSNIFEYMPPNTFQKVGENLYANAAPKSRFAYWNLMVPRTLSSIIPQVVHQENASNLLSRKDNTFFYSQFIIDSKDEQ